LFLTEKMSVFLTPYNFFITCSVIIANLKKNMKKLWMFALALSAVIGANAQEATFKPFKVDIALGYARPGGDGVKAGAIVALEPKYAVSDKVTLGLRMETAIMARVTLNPYGEYVEGDAKGSGSYLATADYYFNTNHFRPFIGAGAGVYRNASMDINSDSDTPETSTQFGFAPRAGFELGHFRTAIEYNVAGKSGEVSNNYLGIKLGFFLGGGRL
jgi:outer membrane protein W